MKYNKFIVLILIYIITIVSTLYLSKIYSNSSNKASDLFLDDYFFNVTGMNYNDLYDNIDNYNNENDNYVIYVSSNDYEQFNNAMRDLVVKNNYKNKILFINYSSVGKIRSINKLINSFCDNCSNLKKDDLPVFICFKNQKIDKIVSVDDIGSDELSSLLEVYYD